MPVHDWTRVDAGLFHNFHQRWISALSDSLNLGVLPPDYYALAEQTMPGAIPDVLTLRLSPGDESGPATGAAPVAVAVAPPRARLIRTTEKKIYARKADRISVRHRSGQVIAVIEIVSPGNKSGVSALATFVQKTADLIEQGVHALVIDLFPPTKRDPQGIHKAIWDQLEDEQDDFTLPPDKPLTLAAYDAGLVTTAYVEPVAAGDVLPDMPLFLEPGYYVNVPLEATYRTTWDVFPRVLKGRLEPPRETEDRSG